MPLNVASFVKWNPPLPVNSCFCVDPLIDYNCWDAAPSSAGKLKDNLPVTPWLVLLATVNLILPASPDTLLLKVLSEPDAATHLILPNTSPTEAISNNPDCFSNKNNIFCCSLLLLLLKKAVAPPAAVISSDPNPMFVKMLMLLY